MAYTKSELIDAFVEARSFVPSAGKTKLQFIQEEIAKVQALLDAQPTAPTAKEIIKDEALRYLSDKSKRESEDL